MLINPKIPPAIKATTIITITRDFIIYIGLEWFSLLQIFLFPFHFTTLFSVYQFGEGGTNLIGVDDAGGSPRVLADFAH